MVETFLAAHPDLLPPGDSFPRRHRESAARTLVQLLSLVDSVDVDALPWDDKAELLDFLLTLRTQHYSGAWLDDAISRFEEVRPQYDTPNLLEAKRALEEECDGLAVERNNLAAELAQVSSKLEDARRRFADLSAQERAHEEACRRVNLNSLFGI